jgi:hypothetical protein
MSDREIMDGKNGIAVRKSYGFRDEVVKNVVDKFVNKIKSRSDVGYKKYGVTLQDDDQSLETWLTHIQEELMDAVNYIEKAKLVLCDEIEECKKRSS